AEVVCVLVTKCVGGRAGMVKLKSEEGELVITPWHPVRWGEKGEWTFPGGVGEVEEVEIDAVYSFLLTSGHELTIGGVKCVTLAHGFEDNDVVRHAYFGSGRIVEDLKGMVGWEDGRVLSEGVERGEDGLVCGLKRPSFPKLDKRIVKLFRTAIRYADQAPIDGESFFHVPYQRLLETHFPDQEDFIVGSQTFPLATLTQSAERGAVDFVTYLIVAVLGCRMLGGAGWMGRVWEGGMRESVGANGIAGGDGKDEDEVEEDWEPVFFVETQAPKAFQKDSSREEADQQMRDRFRRFGRERAAGLGGQFEGMSAFGTRFALYNLP
ncbi:hypothetical protein HK097_003365, partial [Rhizophlyctis rosea]